MSHSKLRVHGPGILHVRSRIASPLLTEPQFLTWYDTEHIPEVTATSGIRAAYRYINVNKTSPQDVSKPYLVIYPMDELKFTLSDEFRRIGFKSEKLPGSGVVYDLAELDVGYYGCDDRVEIHAGTEPAGYLLSIGIRAHDISALEARLNNILNQVSAFRGHARTLRFELQYARTNAQSRALKGLPVQGEEVAEPSTWLAMCEMGEQLKEEDVEKFRMMAEELGDSLRGEVVVWELQGWHVGGRSR